VINSSSASYCLRRVVPNMLHPSWEARASSTLVAVRLAYGSGTTKQACPLHHPAVAAQTLAALHAPHGEYTQGRLRATSPLLVEPHTVITTFP
jgi:hypothetical protein